MNKSNLYNKYRPRSFAEVIGQKVVKKLLTNILNRDKLLQVFLFYGSHGTGKTSVARIFAKMWNCKKFSELGDVCNECRNCKLINEEKTMDICEMDSASHSGVENVREIIHSSHYMPLDLEKKVYLIDECHNLSNSAWNALLKTIEEPSSDKVIFIFLTTKIHKIPKTIISRCQKYNFTLLDSEELKTVIDTISKSENKSFDEDAKKLLICLSQGSARECVSLMEQIFLSSDKSSFILSDVETICALANKEEHLMFLDLLINSNAIENRTRLLELIRDLIEKNKHILNYFKSLLEIIMDIHVYKLTSNSSFLKRINEEDLNRFISYDFSYLKIGDILFNAMSEFNQLHSPEDWAKIILFRMIDAVNDGDWNPSVKTISKPIVAMENLNLQEEDLFFPKDVELKVLYSTVFLNRNNEKSLKNYEIYQNLKNKEDLDDDLKKCLFQSSIIFAEKKLITTDKTALLFFDRKNEADLFNSIVGRNDELQSELNLLFCGNYFWWATTPQQIKFYKDKKPSDLEINKAFDNSLEALTFDQMLDILEEIKK